jgi:transcriptional regulator with XRE-family HTH domain
MSYMTQRQRGNEIGEATRAVGLAIGARRRGLSLTLEEVERRMPAGHSLNPSSLSKIERGLRRIDVDDLAALGAALELHPADLFPTALDGNRVLGSASRFEEARELEERLEVRVSDVERLLARLEKSPEYQRFRASEG